MVKSPQTSTVTPDFILRLAPEFIVRFFTCVFDDIVGCRPEALAVIIASIVQEGKALQGAVPQLEVELNIVSTPPFQVTEVGLEAIGDPIQSSVKPVTKLGGFQLSMRIR